MSTKNNGPISINRDRDLVFHGWFANHPSAGAALPMTPEVDDFIGSVWPMTTAYSSPLNPIWLMQVLDIRLLARRPAWFVRDGIVPLTWFFHRHPSPPVAETRLYIDEELSYLVPDAWRSHVGTYRLHSEAPATASSRLALIGLASESYASLPFLRSRLEMIDEREKATQVNGIDVYLPTRWSHATDEEKEVFHAQYFREIYRVFPNHTRPINRTELMGTFDLQNVRLWDLNEKLLIADNSVVQSLLRKGAQWPQAKPVQGTEVYRRLSSFHGFVTNDEIETNSGDQIQKSLRKAKQYHDLIGDVSRTAAFKEYPWPKWFANWMRSTAFEDEQPISKKTPVATKNAKMKSKAKSKAPAKKKR